MLDNTSPLSLQYQLKTELYEKINTGVWPEGFKIPSENELCEEYGISRITVREALKEMVQAGYLVRKQGKGTYVSKPAVEQSLTSSYSLSADLEQKGQVSEFILLSFKIIESKPSSVALFDIPESEKLYEIIRLRTVDNNAYAWEKAIVPTRYMPDATSKEIKEFGLYPTIEKYSGLYPIEAEEKIEAVICPDAICREMGLPLKSPVMKVKRNTKSQSGYIEKCESYIFGQRLNVLHKIRRKH